ncbi:MULTISPECIES: hypothetical protein [Lactococcus]|uniref:hypothetical protein n=2 Tax=Streptococcaceae TaxID=1300 RepID=UPI00203BEB03|nr:MULTISPECIES: hypothetical protein [Lactococcus]
MNKEQKRKLGVIAVLGLTLLVGGTFAFRSFEQQAINDREREHNVNVGGRVHDYYNRDTENKDVFIENYGERPIMARIRLSEFLETRQRNEDNFTPLVSGTSRENVGSWTRWIPSATDINDRANNNASNAFDRYSQLSFGWSREGQTAPWYLPTFNHDNLDQRTAAAGHARDWIAGGGATDGSTDGTTHPGEGTDGFWSSGTSYTNGSQSITWPGSATATRTTAQNLEQERAPMTIEQWETLPDENKVGNFWVIDQQTGWAYWANRLEPGEATSYLLDAAVMTDAIEETVFNGFSYYAINVESELISPDQRNEFLNDGGNNHVLLAEFLTGINNGVMFDDGPNPAPNESSAPSEFNFSTMRPGRIFTMAGEQYRYLEDMGNGDHMIIRNDALRNVHFSNQEVALASWYGGLDDTVQAIVRPVVMPNNVPSISELDASPWTAGGVRWLPLQWNDNRFDAVRGDRTVVGGTTQRAFALSFADVVRLSTAAGPFPTHRAREAADARWWQLRTPTPDGHAWGISEGALFGRSTMTGSNSHGGVRPALIIHQPTN